MDGVGPNTPDFIVHHYSRNESEPSSSADVLEQGRLILTAATLSGGWRGVSRTFDSTVFELRGTLFEFRQTAPRVEGAKAVEELLEWGTIGELSEDFFITDHLEDFDSSDLTDVFASHSGFKQNPLHPKEVPSSAPAKRVANLDVLEDLKGPKWGIFPSAKRPRLDHESLWKVISQPHIYTTFNLDTTPNFLPSLNFIFHGAKPKPLAPYTTDTYRSYFEDFYARCAWIVPIRGSLPWSECSTASVMTGEQEDSASNQLSLPMKLRDESSLEIVWTRQALRDFWGFLVEVRRRGRLGPLGLSFHAAPAPQSTTESIPATVFKNRASSTDLQSYADQETSADSQSNPVSSSLESIDHFKIYQDATQAVRVRDLLDAWSYKYTEPEDVTGKVKKLRLLKGATFVLVDEISQGVLTC